ncbi:unnamed protein product, partial [Allacma fusca]
VSLLSEDQRFKMAPAAAEPGNVSGSQMFTEVPSKDPHKQVDEKALHLKDADLNIEVNGKQHRTSLYFVMRQDQDRVNQQLVVRRGQEFSLELEFDNPYVKGSDVVTLNFVLRLGQSKKKSHHDAPFRPSTVHINVNDKETKDSTNGWLAHVASYNGKKITVNVTPSPKCAVGKWDLEVLLATRENQTSRRNVFARPLYIIFNPWCPDDDTYYSVDPKHLDTYVLARTGTIYTTNTNYGESPAKIRPTYWDYDQFDEHILDCAVFLLGHRCPNEKQLKVPERGEVVKVIRRLTSQVNSDAKEYDGVLQGRWVGSYSDGRYPTSWTGSKEILQQYYTTKQPVKYGQCWVFAGVLTSVCRALGIPTRPVTNYKSAHEIKRNGRYTLAINEYYDGNTGHPVNSKSDPKYDYDSIWNYHVWCEAWMKRRDIGEIYNGWQVVDATPQEISLETLHKGTDDERTVNIFTMGPAPVVACRRGDVKVDYDVDFLFGEVSSDIIHWYTVGEDEVVYKCIQTNNCVGTNLITEDVENPYNTEDLTNYYKAREGTEESRNVKENALVAVGVSIDRLVLNEKEPEILLYLPKNEKGLRLPRKTYIGEPFKFEIIVENKNAHKSHAGTGWVQVSSAPSSCVKQKLIEEFQLEFDVGPQSQKSFSYAVAYEKYEKILQDIDTILLIEYNASVTNEEIYFFDKTYLNFGRLKLHIDVPPVVKEREKFTATVTVTNRTPLTLPDGVFRIRDVGSQYDIKQKLKLDSPLKPGETKKVIFSELKVKWATKDSQMISLSVKFTSDSTKVSGSKNVEIQVSLLSEDQRFKMAPAAAEPGNFSGSQMFTEVPSKHHYKQVDEKALHLKDADLNIEVNGTQHRTNEYSVMSQDQARGKQQLVVRRGQEFSLELEFDNPYVKGSDLVTLNFGLQMAQPKKKSHDMCFGPSTVHVKVNDERTTETPNRWLAHVESVKGKKITVIVKPPPNCPIGKWDLEVLMATYNEKQPGSRKYAFSRPLYIIFNPWSPEDGTYYSEDPQHLDTYVLASEGIVYKGTSRNGKPKPLYWDYGQFNENILDCAVHLLNHSCKNEPQLSPRERGDVVAVIRRLASVVNSEDIEKDGVLLGKWPNKSQEDPYKGGHSPHYWKGSTEILQAYYNAKQDNPKGIARVKYGQCWVFAAVLTSVCRALGIPTKPVTNYQSGHEVQRKGYTLAINKYYETDTGKKVDPKCHPKYSFDSIWNYHVWCEAWMKRGDIGEIYNGWQVVDATPQETSLEKLNKCTDDKRTVKIFTMGPAPVVACRRGDVNVDYDVDFLFGEVNSDIIYWYAVGEDKFIYKSMTKDRTGMQMSTENVKGGRKDLTKFYKPSEGTDEARNVKRNALEKAGVSIDRLVLNEKEPEILLYLPENEKGFRLPRETYIGKPVKFEIIVENRNAKKTYPGTGWVQVYTAPSSHKTCELIEEFQLEFDVEPKSQKSFSYAVAYEKYKEFLLDIETVLLIEYNASVTNKDIHFFDQTFLTFAKLKLAVNVPSSVKMEEKYTATVTMKNMTSITLPDGVFRIRDIGQKDRGTNIYEERVLESPLKPDETITVTFSNLEPHWNKKNIISLSVDFTSYSTKVCGYKHVEIQANSGN